MTRPTDAELADWLDAQHRESRHERLNRLRFVVDEFGAPRHLLLPGGFLTLRAFEEAKSCFVNGDFIGCILLSQLGLERLIGGLFRLSGRDDLERAGFADLLQEALQERYLSEREFEIFDGLRRMRNPYAHNRPPMHAEGLIPRVVATGKEPEELFEEDARRAIRALFSIFTRPPFAFPPDEAA